MNWGEEGWVGGKLIFGGPVASRFCQRLRNPCFLANPNTAEPANTVKEAQPTINTIHRGGARPSALSLWVVGEG